MKFRFIFLSVLICLLLTGSVNRNIPAFSGPLQQFIKDGKTVRLLISNNIEKVLISTEEDTEIIDLQSNSSVRLVSKKDYLICIDGASDRITLSDLQGHLLLAGRYLEIMGKISLNGEIYPGKTEFILSRDEVNIYNTPELSSLISALLTADYAQTSQEEYQLVKAAAVIFRTMVLDRVLNSSEGRINLPFYQGINDVSSLIRNAVNSTDGQILMDRGVLTSVNYLLPTEVVNSGLDYRDLLQDYYPGLEFVDLSKMTEDTLRVEAGVKWGLKYKEISQFTWWGPRVITILDLNDKLRYVVQPVLAGGKISGLADLNELVISEKVLAGINGGYFTYTGRPLGLLMINEQLVSEPLKRRAAFCITRDNNYLISRVDWQGFCSNESGEKIIRITGVNRSPGMDEVVIINRYYGDHGPPVGPGIRELVISRDRIIAINEEELETGTIIPEDGFLLQIHGEQDFKIGEKVIYRDEFTPDLEDQEVIHALGAGPILIQDSQIMISAAEEEFQPDIASGRAPRSAVGIKDDGNLVFFTVDGRQPDLSIGITLENLADFMLKYGIVEGMNLDGGSSARMVVRGYTMNNPSDQRLISNGLLFKEVKR